MKILIIGPIGYSLHIKPSDTSTQWERKLALFHSLHLPRNLIYHILGN